MYFYVTYPLNRGFSTFLDLLRFVAEPSAIRFSHLTVRGPYRRLLGREQLEEINRRLPNKLSVQLTAPSRFFDGGQNTVLLDADIGVLREVWDKPDYPYGIGHITMYDGRDRSEAVMLFNVLCEYNWTMKIRVTEVRLLEPKVMSSSLLAGMSSLCRAYEKFDLTGMPAFRQIPDLPFAERMRVYRRLLASSHMNENALAMYAEMA